MTLISVMIPTMRRPESFLRAARSVLTQTGVGASFEIIAVDNAPEGSAAEAFALFSAEASAAGVPFRHAHEPNPGVANARNAAMGLAKGDLIACLDDDEEAPLHWLAALLRVQRETKADAVFGPVMAQLPPNTSPHAAFFESVYTRTGPAQSGPVDRYYGMGNSLVVRATILPNTPPFDLEANEKGGEDDLLFSKAQAKGCRFAWAADAPVIEHLPPARATLRHAIKRSFAYGQGPCEAAASLSPPDWAAIAKHMVVGICQMSVFGILAALAFAIRAKHRLWLLDKAARGAGKVFWWSPQRFYGAHALISEANAPK